MITNIVDSLLMALIRVLWWWFWFGVVSNFLGNKWSFLLIVLILFVFEMDKRNMIGQL